MHLLSGGSVMAQKISIKIASRTFNLTANSPEQEVYRLAAEAIDKRYNAFLRSNPGQSVQDLMSMVALTETVVRINLQREMDRFCEAEKVLEEDLAGYLKSPLE